MDPLSIKQLIDGMKKDCDVLKHNCLKYTWYMRGGVSYSEVMNMSRTERDAISKIIEENIETTKTTKLPFF